MTLEERKIEADEEMSNAFEIYRQTSPILERHFAKNERKVSQPVALDNLQVSDQVAWCAAYDDPRMGRIHSDPSMCEAEIDALVSKCDGRIVKVALYDHAVPCPRCAEYAANINQLAREQAQKMVNNGTYSDKLAALEAENARLKTDRDILAVSDGEKAATIAQQAERIKAYEESTLRSVEQFNQLHKQLAAAEAKIDELMFEYDPEAMTPEQFANYVAHQVPATTEEQAAIDAAIAANKLNKESQ